MTEFKNWIVNPEAMIPTDGNLEALKIETWGNNDRTMPGKVVIDSDSIILKAYTEQKYPMPKEDENIFKFYFRNNIPVLFIPVSSFPTLCKTNSAHSLVRTAYEICRRENWPFNIYHMRAALNNLEMAMND